MDRRRAGHRLDKPDAAVGLPLERRTSGSISSPSIVTVLLFSLACESAARPHRARDGRDPRPSDRGRGAWASTPRIYKSLTFGVSAMYTGIAGALGAIVVQFVAPDSFRSSLSISFLVGIVVGGLASISGAFFGALFIEFVPNVADQISKAAPWAIYGLFLIAFMYVMPSGVAGLIRRLWLALLTATNSKPGAMS